MNVKFSILALLLLHHMYHFHNLKQRHSHHLFPFFLQDFMILILQCIIFLYLVSHHNYRYYVFKKMKSCSKFCSLLWKYQYILFGMLHVNNVNFIFFIISRVLKLMNTDTISDEKLKAHLFENLMNFIRMKFPL